MIRNTIGPGARDAKVEDAQAWLNTWLAMAGRLDLLLKVDGRFSSEMTEVVELFQAAHTDATGRQLRVDGWIGRASWPVLEQYAPAPRHTAHVPRIVVINRSRGRTDREVQRMADVVAKQCELHVANYWGLIEVVRGTDSDLTGNPLEWPAEVVDESSVPGAAGWHSVQFGAEWVPHCEVSLNGGIPPAAVLSHEAIEKVADSHVNRSARLHAHALSGYDLLLEPGDQVNGQTYELDGELVHNFTLPAWWGLHDSGTDPQGFSDRPAVDFARRLKEVGEIAPRGYQIAFRDGQMFWLTSAAQTPVTQLRTTQLDAHAQSRLIPLYQQMENAA